MAAAIRWFMNLTEGRARPSHFPRTFAADGCAPHEAPKARESLVVTAISAAAMIGLYSGLDGRNARLLSEGPLFAPVTSLDESIPLFVPFVWVYYAYFPLTLAIHFVTRLRREWLFEYSRCC